MAFREIHIDELYAPAREDVSPPFASIVCGIDGCSDLIARPGPAAQ